MLSHETHRSWTTNAGEVAAGARPCGLWLLLLFVAFGGSMFFGWAVALCLGLPLVGTALWLTLGAGAGWAALIPALALLRVGFWPVLHACLVAIGVGEAVLVSGGALGLLIGPDAIYYWLVVGASNVLMAGTVTMQLRQVGVPAWKSLLLWLLVLDGVGVLAFYLLAAPLGVSS